MKMFEPPLFELHIRFGTDDESFVDVAKGLDQAISKAKRIANELKESVELLTSNGKQFATIQPGINDETM